MTENKNKPVILEQKPSQIHRDNWDVMRPFVRFSFQAIKLIAMALMMIVRLVLSLKPREHTHEIRKR